MTYHDALRYLYGLVDYEKRRIERYSPREFKLERVAGLLEKLGNPHNNYPTLHIAGTKGKGSVSAMLAGLAQAGGLKTGLYISPHLHTYRERFQINRKPISRAALTQLVEAIKPVVETVPDVTTFEVATAIAFQYFAQEEVDIAVMEVGLGGRLDATNVITPEISVITSLSLDHTSLLGNTLTEIAFEKGGIIKPGIPVVTAPQQPEALDKLKQIARERNASITVVGEDTRYSSGARTYPYQTFTMESLSPDLDPAFSGEYKLSLLGDFQVENAATAITAAQVLYKTGHVWASPDAMHQSLENVSWAGRMEVLRDNPPIVVDCAHNPYSIEVLMHSMKAWFPDTKWVLIYGASSDKDIDSMLKTLIPEVEHIIVTRSYHPRASSPYALADQCAVLGKGAEIAVDAGRSLEQACSHLQDHNWGILATGSVFLVADIREAWNHQSELKLDLPEGDWVDEPW